MVGDPGARDSEGGCVVVTSALVYTEGVLELASFTSAKKRRACPQQSL